MENINGFVPLPGTHYKIASFGSRSGDTNIIKQTSYAGLRFDKTYTSSDLTLTAAAIFSGDADLNGIVNTADFAALAAHFNQSGQNWLSGDFNGDGKVNALDFNAIAANFGQALPAPAREQSCRNQPESPRSLSASWLGAEGELSDSSQPTIETNREAMTLAI